jgi:hypothetical protein
MRKGQVYEDRICSRGTVIGRCMTGRNSIVIPNSVGGMDRRESRGLAVDGVLRISRRKEAVIVLRVRGATLPPLMHKSTSAELLIMTA